MPLPTFDKKEQIPAGFEDEYEERDGKWVPIDRSANLSKALREEREAREAAEKLAKKAAKDLADATTKKQAMDAGRTEEEYKKLYDTIEKSVRDEFEPKLKGYEELQKEVRTLKLDSKVKEMFKAGGALDAHIGDFWKLHGDEFDLTSDGKPMVKAEPGKDVARHVQGILAGRKTWVQGTKATGGGSTAGSTTSKAAPGLNPGGISFDDMVKNPAAAIAVANER